MTVETGKSRKRGNEKENTKKKILFLEIKMNENLINKRGGRIRGFLFTFSDKKKKTRGAAA